MNQVVRKNPWLGLASYKEGEVIYGRDDDIRDLSQCVLNDNVTLLYGKSGIGKSSILNAGILPAARRAGYVPLVIRFSHKGEVSYLHQLRFALEESAVTPREEIPCKDKSLEDFYEFFHRHTFYDADGNRTKLLIIFDQFEEIFTLQENMMQKKEFFISMADLLNNVMPNRLEPQIDVSTPEYLKCVDEKDIDEVFNDLNLGIGENIPDYVDDNDVHFIFSLREDFLSEFEYYSAAIPSLRQNRYGLRPINEEQAAQIIMKPIPGLVDEYVTKLIIEKVTGRKDFELDGMAEIETDSALLSLYLTRLYEAMDSKVITAELIEKKGEEIISEFYHEAMSEVSSSTTEYFESVLLNGQGRRDNVTVYDAISIGKVLQSEIDLLCNKKILRCFNYAGDFRLEFIHDILCPIVMQQRKDRAIKMLQENQKKMISRMRQNNRKRIFYLALLLALAGAIVSFLMISNKHLDNLNDELIVQQQKILRSQQKLLSVKIQQLLDNDDSYLAKRLALNVLSQDHSGGLDQMPASFKGNIREMSNTNTAILQGHGSAVDDVAFSPIDSLLASVSDTTIFIWDTSNGKLLKTLSGESEKISCIAFSDDGANIAAGMYNGAIRVFSVETGQEVFTMQEKHKARVRYLSYVSDGNRIVSASADKSVIFWNAEDGSRLRVMPNIHLDEVLYLAFSNDYRRMASASADHTIKIWDTDTDTLVAHLSGHEDWVRSVAFNPKDNNYLLSASDDGRIRLWNLETQKDTIFQRANSYVTRALYSSDAKNIVASYRDGSVRVWDVKTQTEKSHLQGTHNTSYANAVAISYDCTMFASAGSDNVIHLWDLTPPLKTGEYSVDDGGLLHVSTSGDYIVIMAGNGQGENKVICYDVQKLEQGPLWTEVIRGKKFRHSVINLNKNAVAIVGYKTIIIRDLKTGKILSRNDEAHSGWIYSIVCSPDGEYLVSAGFDRDIKMWDWELKLVKAHSSCHNKMITSLAYSRDGAQLVSASADSTCKIWNVDQFVNQETPTPIVLKGHKSDVLSVVFSRDGRSVLSASRDRTAKMWDIETAQCIKTYSGHSGNVNAAIFSENEDEIVTVSSDKIVRIWSAETEKELIGLYGHNGSVTSIASNSDGTVIYTVSHDGSLQVWDYPSLPEIIADIRARFGKYPLAQEELNELDVI